MSKGLSFVPTPGPTTFDKLFTSSLEKYFRSIRLRYHFGVTLKTIMKNKHDATNHTPPSSSSSSPPRPTLSLPSTVNIKTVKSACIEEYIKHTRNAFTNLRLTHTRRRNTSHDTRMILQRMRNHPSIIIKPADKNLGITIMTRTWYESEMMRQLNDTCTYKQCAWNAFTLTGVQAQIKSIAQKGEKNGVLSSKEGKYITVNPTVRQSACPLYGMPKIHKLSNAVNELHKLTCRPIVSCVTYITTPLSQWIDWVLQPLVQMIPTVIKDSKTFVNMIESFRIEHRHKDECILMVADIASLYPNIPTDDGIIKMRRFLNRDVNRRMLRQQYPDESVNINTVIDIIITSLTIVLRNNYIEFDGQTYIQVNGTAMGQSCAVVYANVYVYELEADTVSACMQSNIMLMYARFIDDVFAVISHTSHTSHVITTLNGLHPSIQFNCVTSSTEVEFLDTVIYKGDRYRDKNILDTRVHQKLINKYLYIPYSSFHTYHNKVGWIKAELIRYIRNTSSFDRYLELKRLFYRRLRDRGYSPSFLRAVMHAVTYSDRSKMLAASIKTQSTKRDAPLCFISTLHPCVTHEQLVRALTANWKLLARDPELRSVLGDRPIVGYKRSANLQNVLVRSKYTRASSV